MKINLLIDRAKYSIKPACADIKAINNRIINCAVEVTIEEIATYLTAPNGQTWIPAILEGKRKNSNWKHQQIFALDFDGGIPLDEVLNRLKEYGLDCTFAYSTFSSSAELPKFRVVWQLNHVVIDKEHRDRIQLALMNLFPECDKHCQDAARVFFGGKELIYANYEYYLDVNTLIDSCVIYSARDCERPDKTITMKLNKLKIGQKCAEPNNIFRDCSDLSLNSTQGESIENESRRVDLLERVDFDDLRKNVKILDDLMNPDIKVLHPKLFGLATNLRYIKGGEKLFKKCLEANSLYAKDKYAIMPYIKKRNYLPMNLSNFSPYEEDWEYKNLLEAAKLPRGKVIRIIPYETITLEIAEKRLEEVFNQALADTEHSIWIIKKSTGLGGTEKLLDLKGATIAFPNHALKDEVSNRFRVKHLVTRNLPDGIEPEVRQRIDYYYSVGAIEKATQVIKEQANQNEQLAAYYNNLIQARTCKDTVLTTHTKAVHIEFNSNTLIFDEDPLSNILTINSFTLNDLNRLIHSVTNAPDKDNLKKYQDIITNGLSNCVENTKQVIFNDIDAIENIVLENKNYESGIVNFLYSDYYCVNSQDTSKVDFLKKNELPSNKKVIILSATANERIYKQLYGNRVKFVDISNVELTGMINQDVTYSMSRDSLKRENGLNYAINKVGELPVITFLPYKKNFPNYIDDMHFGKTTGFDSLKGKDIAVVGTPHIPIITYLLYAKALGIDVKPQDFRLSLERVRHNGFEFRINTFVKPELKNIQFHFIEEQIKQAVGRARVLREPATVLLLSGYPLPEACITQEEKQTNEIRIARLKQMEQ